MPHAMWELKEVGLIMPCRFAVTRNIEPQEASAVLRMFGSYSLGSKSTHYADIMRPGSSRAG